MPKLLPDLGLGVLFSRPRGQPRAVDLDSFRPQLIAGGNAAPELCQLAEQTWSPASHPADALVDLKADGIRHLWIGGQQVTREGTPFTAAAHVRPALLELERLFGKPMFFDGEYVHEDGLEAAGIDFKRGKGTGTIWLFDAVPLDVWRKCAASAPLSRRRDMLLDTGAKLFEGGDFLGALQPFRLNADQTFAKATELWALGFEGVVVKAAASLYERRRSTAWQKLKQLFRAECRIVDMGCDQQTGRMKHLLVSHNGRTQKIGTGFTPEQRFNFGRQPDIGQHAVAVVEFAGETKAGLMREARFVQLRGK